MPSLANYFFCFKCTGILLSSITFKLDYHICVIKIPRSSNGSSLSTEKFNYDSIHYFYFYFFYLRLYGFCCNFYGQSVNLRVKKRILFPFSNEKKTVSCLWGHKTRDFEFVVLTSHVHSTTEIPALEKSLRSLVLFILSCYIFIPSKSSRKVILSFGLVMCTYC